MFDDKINEESFMETDVADFFTALAAGIGFEDEHISSWTFENVYIDPEAFEKVNDYINDNDVIEKIKRYAEGASWEESGMSSLNSDICHNGLYDESTAERRFLYFYTLHSGQFQIDIYNKYGSDYANNDVINEKYYDPILKEVRNRLKGQVSLIGGDDDDDYDGDDWTQFDYSVVPLTMSNYYTRQLDTYETNYQDAMSKIDNMITKLTALYDSFIGATGNDISKIRNDLTDLITDLDNVKTKIANAREKTFDRAFSCARCYANWFTDERHHKVSINSDNNHPYGYITVNDEEVYEEATLEEMLNS